jgi:hypothetical protein
MGLLRLLTAGKSLVGLKDPEARYRMTDPRALPKFGSEKNPFNRPWKSGPAQNPAAGIAAVQQEAPKPAGLSETQRGDETSGLVPSGSLRKNSTLRLPEARTAAAPAARLKAAEPRQGSRAAGPIGSFVSKLKPLLNFQALKKRTAAPTEPRPVQGELSLDKVKVLRNDLSDTDFVIVRKKAQPATESGFAFAEKSETRSATPAQQTMVSI